MKTYSDRPTAPIIQRPERVPPVKRTFWGAITAAFWIVYIYLWMPLITLVLWILGVRKGYAELYLRDHSIDPFILVMLPLLALLALVSLIGWAEYNRHRFSDRDRRSWTEDVGLDQVAKSLEASPAMAERMQQAKAITLHMDDEAAPTGITPVLLSPALASARPG